MLVTLSLKAGTNSASIALGEPAVATVFDSGKSVSNHAMPFTAPKKYLFLYSFRSQVQSPLELD